MSHTHKFAKLRKTHDYRNLEDLTHDHKNGEKPHVHDGLTDDGYLKRVADREKASK